LDKPFPGVDAGPLERARDLAHGRLLRPALEGRVDPAGGGPVLEQARADEPLPRRAVVLQGGIAPVDHPLELLRRFAALAQVRVGGAEEVAQRHVIGSERTASWYLSAAFAYSPRSMS